MDDATDSLGPSADAALDVTLRPYRSLSPRGFLILMAILVTASVATGVAFFLIGAWPVPFFLGLDVALVYIAFRANYRAATAFEEISVTSSELRVRKVSHRGQASEWTLNPVWVRLEREVHEEFGIERLFLVSHGRRLPIAAFLGPQEKESFAAALAAALGEARRGPPQPAFP